MLAHLFRLSRSYKVLIAVTYDVLAIMLSYWLAYYVSEKGFSYSYALPPLVGVLLFYLSGFIALSLYRSVTRYMIAETSLKLIIVIAFGVAVLLGIQILEEAEGWRLSSVLIFFLSNTVLIVGSRLLLKGMFLRNIKKGKLPVLIYGAGAAGRQLATALIDGDEYRPVAFLDDNSALQNHFLMGLRVYPPTDAKHLVEHYEAAHILLAIPSATATRRKHVLEQLESLNVTVKTIPGMNDIVADNSQLSRVKDIQIEDLLGRDPVPAKPELMTKTIEAKTVLVTGAGGSIGAELCRQIVAQNPQHIILLEMGEYNLYQVEQELVGTVNSFNLDVRVTPLLGDASDTDFVSKVFSQFSINTIYHAAAYKHVPLVEANVVNGVMNNVASTACLAAASIKFGVEHFTLVSTDKAVRPTNMMGASKRVAELIVQAYSAEFSQCCFAIVRFGNVLGSSGSVIPKFRKQVAEGGPVTVTHPDVTRYFMTIPEAAQLVIQASAICNSGDVFILDMGEPIKIQDLARSVIHLSGLHVAKGDNAGSGEVAIQYTGLRPGEKLFEELLVNNASEPTVHPRIMKAREATMTYSEVIQLVQQLKACAREYDVSGIKKLIYAAPTALCKNHELSDWLINDRECKQ